MDQVENSGRGILTWGSRWFLGTARTLIMTHFTIRAGHGEAASCCSQLHAMRLFPSFPEEIIFLDP